MQRNSAKGALSSAGSEHLPYKQRVGGSNPSAPTTFQTISFHGLMVFCIFVCFYSIKTRRVVVWGVVIEIFDRLRHSDVEGVAERQNFGLRCRDARLVRPVKGDNQRCFADARAVRPYVLEFCNTPRSWHKFCYARIQFK